MSIVAYLASLDAYINPYSKHLICQLSPPFYFLFFSTHVELILTEYSSVPWRVPACISFLYAAAIAPSMIRLLDMLSLAYYFAMVVRCSSSPLFLKLYQVICHCCTWIQFPNLLFVCLFFSCLLFFISEINSEKGRVFSFTTSLRQIFGLW